jgi:hypothetical protein
VEQLAFGMTDEQFRKMAHRRAHTLMDEGFDGYVKANGLGIFETRNARLNKPNAVFNKLERLIVAILMNESYEWPREGIVGSLASLSYLQGECWK